MATVSPLVIAHRGYSARFPENTMIAFEQALRHPIDGIELDVQWTRDEVAVCFHDRTLHRLGAGKIALRNRNYRDVAQVDAGRWFHPDYSGVRLARLEAVLDRFGHQTQWLLEIKRRELGNKSRLQGLLMAVIRLLKARGLEKKSAILSFNFELLKWGQQRAPEIRYVLNQTRPQIMENDDFLYAYDVRTSTLNHAFVKAVKGRNKKVFTYTVNHMRDLRRMLTAGVDGLMTDDPVWLAQSLELLP